MSKILPTILTVENPINLDKVIADLQDVIASARYIDKEGSNALWFDQGQILPLALKDQKTGGPIVYWQKNEYFPAVPNDNFRAVAFFYQEDPGSFQSIDNVQYNINLVVWFNQDKYARDKNFQVREFFITELVKLLRSALRGGDKSSIEEFRELENIYSNYSFISETKERLKYPYQGFRIKLIDFRAFDCGDNALLNLSPGPVPPLTEWDKLVNKIGRGYNYPQPTGQTTIFRTGDDADIEATIFAPIREANSLKAQNSLLDFFILNNDNAFGNVNRFTDSVGGQDYDGTDGSLVNYVVDNYTGIAVFRTAQGVVTWNAVIDAAQASTNLGFNNWFVLNKNMLNAIRNEGDSLSTHGLNYAPLNIPSTNFWLSTTNPVTTPNAFRVVSSHTTSTLNKTIVSNYFLARKHF